MQSSFAFTNLIWLLGFTSFANALPPGEYLGQRNPVWLTYMTKKSETEVLHYFAEYRQFPNPVFRPLGWLAQDRSKHFDFSFLGGSKKRTVIARDRENGSVYVADLQGGLSSEPIAREVQTLQPMSRTHLLLGQGKKLVALDTETHSSRELYDAQGRVLAVERSSLHEIHWIEARGNTNSLCGGQLFHWPWRIQNVWCKELKKTESAPNRLLVKGESVWIESTGTPATAWGQILTRTTQHYGKVFQLPALEYSALDLTEEGTLELRLKEGFLLQMVGEKTFSPSFARASVHAVFSPKSNEWIPAPEATQTTMVQTVRDGHEDWLLSTLELCVQPFEPLTNQK